MAYLFNNNNRNDKLRRKYVRIIRNKGITRKSKVSNTNMIHNDVHNFG